MSSSEILAEKERLSTEERQICECLAEIITAEDRSEYGQPYLEGLRLLLSQPEFSDARKMLEILEMLEGEDWLKCVLCQKFGIGEIKVVIGEENPEPALRSLSFVVSQYGIPGRVSGIVAVIGPKRMNYAKVISSLNCLTTLLSNSVAEYV